MSGLFDLRGRRVLVTGASRGIGRALAIGLAEHGAHVCGVARSAGGLAETRRIAGSRMFTVVADLSEADEVRRTVHESVRALGGLDVLVNNAGTDHRRSVEQTSRDDWAAVHDVTLRLVFELCREAGPHLRADGGGKVVNIASVLGTRAMRANSAYVTAKHGVIGLTKSLALEWARAGVQVNAIAPGFIRTDMTGSLHGDEELADRIASRTPIGRWGEPPDIVGAAVFLSAAASDFVTGHVLFVDGGLAAQ